MATTKPEPVDYFTLLGYVKELNIKLYVSNQIDCNFTESEMLGSGNSMNVYRGYLLEDATDLHCKRIPVAIKVPKANTKDMNRESKVFKVLADVRQELRMMKHFETHPNIISLYGVVFQDLKPFTIVELAEGSIADYLVIKKDDNMPVDWETKARFCCEVADGLQALHTANIVHGDLKGDNILLFKDYEDKLVAKITDFGYSATIASIERGGRTGGSLHFLAPECTKYAPTNMKKYENQHLKDKYAFGLFVWQVAKDGEIPYEEMDEDEIQKLKNEDKNLDELMDILETDTPLYFRNVITAMTKYSPVERENLTMVREMMEIEVISDASFAMAKKNLELYAKDLPRDVAKADLSSIELMSIPPSLKSKIYRNYEKAATNGDADAMFMMAICYSTGFAVKMDKVKAFEWCIEAARANSLKAMINIAENYGIKNLPVETKIAFPWYLKAAEKGYKNAILRVFYCYNSGDGVDRDPEKASNWLHVYNTIASTSDVNMSIGETSLHRAARIGNVKAARFLLEQKNTDINTKNKHGQTALHTAAQYGHTELVKLLITTFGADTNTRTNSNKTPSPLELAAGRGHVEVVRLFEDEAAITRLDLSATKLGPTEARLMAESLNMYLALTQLILTDNSIGDEGAYVLAEFLKQNMILTQLELGRNSIGDKGTNALAECLKQNTAIKQLDIEYNRIGVEGACSLAECLKQNSSLTQLGLGRNSIGVKGAFALAECLKQNSVLTQLNLESNNFGDEGACAMAECLKQNTTLTQLKLQVNSIGDKGACALAKCLKQNSTLIQLELWANNIGVEGASALSECLRQNSALAQLGLGMNSIGVEGACALAECLRQNSVLTQLNLERNSIGDDGACALAECLKQNLVLTHLNLWKNSIGDEGACALAEYLKQNSVLTYMNLRRNCIGDVGASALAECLNENLTLIQLELEGNEFGDETVALLNRNTIFVL